MSFKNTVANSNGLFDFQKMVIAVTKMVFKKHSPIERHYRDYKYFNQTKCNYELKEKFSARITINYKSFETSFTEVLNKHSLLRKKFLGANHVTDMTKALRKAIMY